VRGLLGNWQSYRDGGEIAWDVSEKLGEELL